MKYTEDDRVNQIQSMCIEKNYIFCGFLNKYENSYSKLILKCLKHGVWETGTINGFINNGKGCPKCSGNQPYSKQQAIEKVIKSCSDRGYIFQGFVGEYKGGSSTKLILECPDHGVWKSTTIAKFIKRDQGCKECGFKKISRIKAPKSCDRLKQINDICDRRGYIFKGFVGLYKNSSTRISLECSKHGIWSPTIHDFVNGGFGCASCAKTGFDENKQSHLYCIMSKCGRYVKVGISNNKTNRFKQLRRKTPFAFENVGSIRTFDLPGANARSIEKMLLGKFDNADFSGFDGATEWLLYEPAIFSEITNKISSLHRLIN